MHEVITGSLFKEMILHGAILLSAEKQAVNDLNVFPVPDGDTGTNMSMTIGTAVTELKRQEPDTVGKAASVTASALLRGARGNSGVILSLLFRGISKSLKGLETADALTFANAMQEGVAAAYGAVMKPAEGTVLTVSRLAAKAAVDAANEGCTLQQLFTVALETGYEALAQTTDMNPVLKKAGVVDAGGKGYLLILEGMAAACRGEALPEAPEDDSPDETNDKADFAALGDEEITFAFDTVYIIRKHDPDVDLKPLREYLDSIGDSLVIGEDDEAFKVHVHTNIPGSALTESQKYGTLELAKIENMRTQRDDLAAGRKAQSVDDLTDPEEDNAGKDDAPAAPEKPFGYLAVCAGDGLAAAFRDLGVDYVVSGGQTMNPSTESILAGINRIPAETVFVLPNNGNIIMAAQQCEGLTDKRVIVIPTKTVPQGISAMMSIDFEATDADVIAAGMNESIGSVSTASVTYAARNSDFDGFDIHEGDYLALEENRLFGTDRSLVDLLGRLAASEAEKSPSFISLYYGADVTEAEAEAAAEIFRQTCPDAEIAILRGGQPVYFYLISFE